MAPALDAKCLNPLSAGRLTPSSRLRGGCALPPLLRCPTPHGPIMFIFATPAPSTRAGTEGMQKQS